MTRVLCDTKLSRSITVAKSIPRSTGSSTRSPRHSRTPPPPPTRLTVLWRSWRSSLDFPRTTLPRRVTTYSTSSCRLRSLSLTPWRGNGMLLGPPCMGPTSGTSSCHGSKIPKTFSPFWTITSTWPPEAAKTRTSRFRTRCVPLRTPLVPPPSKLSNAPIRQNHHSFAVSVTCTRTINRLNFERPLSSSSLSSVTNGSILLIQSWSPTK